MTVSRNTLSSTAALVALLVAGVVADAAAGGPPSGIDVSVVNTPLPVLTRGLDERGRNPYQARFQCTSSEGGCAATAAAAVPSGKRLVIEMASVRLFLAPGKEVQGVELRSPSDSDLTLYLPSQFIGSVPGLGDVFYATQRVIFYYEAGETPQVFGQFSLGNTGVVQVTLTGYLVDL